MKSGWRIAYKRLPGVSIPFRSSWSSAASGLPTSIERALVRTIAESQWRIDRILDWQSRILDEGIEGDLENTSTLLRTLSKSSEPSEALDRLHRYETLYRRSRFLAIPGQAHG
jgi:hypothetical protein